MNFCVKCDNMYYMKIDSEENGKLIYYCRNCGNEDSNISLSNLCVSTYEDSVSQKNNKINEYTKFDPTLPHVYNIKCLNDNCDSNKKDKPADVIYIRVDDKNMKYMYLCVNCDTSWTP